MKNVRFHIMKVMKKSHREFLSRADIAERVSHMREVLLGDSDDLTKPAPLKKILEIMVVQQWIDFSDAEDLGYSINAKKIRGRFTVDPLKIQVCSSLERWGAEFKFVLAHEIGHLALHRKLIGKGKYIDKEKIPADTSEELKYGDKATLSDLGWVEWQANEFAANLILPFQYLIMKVAEQQQVLGLKKKLGILFLDGQPQNQLDCNTVVSKLSEKFCINRDFLWARLKALEILQDRRKDFVHGSYDCYRGLLYEE